jgi:undecaprenyl phosphate-alpha-L-ara4N flippase subunit ArnE
MILRTLALVGGCVLLETTEQSLYRMAGHSGRDRPRFFGFVAPAVVAHVARLALWYLVLKTVGKLGLAIPLLGLDYLVIALTGKLLFHERVDGRRWFGTALVVVGFLMVAGHLD